MITRSDLRDLARLRVKEAKTLVKNKCYSGAYYLAGYTIECALKACIAKKTKKSEFPDLETVKRSYQHIPEGLVSTSGLKIDLEKKILRDRHFAARWAIVVQWKPESRYEIKSQREAEGLLEAITDSRKGVLRWIGQYW